MMRAFDDACRRIVASPAGDGRGDSLVAGPDRRCACTPLGAEPYTDRAAEEDSTNILQAVVQIHASCEARGGCFASLRPVEIR